MKPFRSAFFAIALALAGASAAACAHAPTVAQTTVEIYDRTEGRVLPVYRHEGRRFVVGKPGNEYAIRVRNGGAGRVLAVTSVDGVNVITGDTASPQQSGYVLAPYESAEIAGWRTSLSRTAAFYFTSLPDSYAARTGRPDNVGVIGVAIFAERPRPVAIDPLGRNEAGRADARTTEASPAAPANQAGAPRDQAAKLGTGYGRGETSYASYTRFERASETPVETIAIYYDSLQNLLAQGVPVVPIARNRPDPFPDSGRFVPHP